MALPHHNFQETELRRTDQYTCKEESVISLLASRLTDTIVESRINYNNNNNNNIFNFAPKGTAPTHGVEEDTYIQV